MSIVSLRYRTRRAWLRWLMGFFSFALAAGRLATSGAVEVELPAEPAETVIVSDDGDQVASTDKSEQPEKNNEAPPADEKPAAPIEENSTAKPTSDEDAEPDAEHEQVDIGEEIAAEEVAPIGEPVPDVPPPDDQGSDDSDPSGAEQDSQPADKSTPAARPVVEGASFKGVIPSLTTAEELEEAWGPANELRKTAGGVQHIYQIKPFKQVVATVANGKVDTVIMHLEKMFEPQVLTRQLKLDDVEPATIFNDKGQMLGMTFPERGVLFGFAPGTPVRIAQVVLEPINSQPFVTRAEKNCLSHPDHALADVDYAIEIDPDYDRAHAVKARIHCELGQFSKALASIERALSLAENEPEYRLSRAKILLQMHDFSQAAKIAEKLSGEEKLPTLARAQAQMVWGDALARGGSTAFDEAIKHHTETIKFAEQSSAKTAGPVRRAARELLMDAHLAVAYDIAWGNWQQKSKVVPKWIDRATAFCESVIKKEQAGESLRLRVYLQTMHAYAGTKDAPDLTSKIDTMNELGRKLIADEPAESRRQMLTWQLGEAMASAMLIAQNQGHPDAATQFGQQSLAYFEQAGPVGEMWPGREQTVGKVYYRLGAVQAIDKAEHAKAAAWYEKAVPLLESPATPSVETGRLGEMFVSMAVSFWESDKREEAVRLTQQGAKLMEGAVADELLSKDALAVPYGNLASMHAELGNSTQSKQFAEMAAKLDTIRR